MSYKIPHPPTPIHEQNPHFSLHQQQIHEQLGLQSNCLCKILSTVGGSGLWWRRREPLFEEGCKAGPCVKFRTQNCGSGGGRLLL